MARNPGIAPPSPAAYRRHRRRSRRPRRRELVRGEPSGIRDPAGPVAARRRPVDLQPPGVHPARPGPARHARGPRPRPGTRARPEGPGRQLLRHGLRAPHRGRPVGPGGRCRAGVSVLRGDPDRPPRRVERAAERGPGAGGPKPAHGPRRPKRRHPRPGREPVRHLRHGSQSAWQHRRGGLLQPTHLHRRRRPSGHRSPPLRLPRRVRDVREARRSAPGHGHLQGVPADPSPGAGRHPERRGEPLGPHRGSDAAEQLPGARRVDRPSTGRNGSGQRGPRLHPAEARHDRRAPVPGCQDEPAVHDLPRSGPRHGRAGEPHRRRPRRSASASPAAASRRPPPDRRSDPPRSRRRGPGRRPGYLGLRGVRHDAPARDSARIASHDAAARRGTATPAPGPGSTAGGARPGRQRGGARRAAGGRAP